MLTYPQKQTGTADRLAPKSLIWQIKYIRNIVPARESHHKPVYSMVQLLKALLNF